MLDSSLKQHDSDMLASTPSVASSHEREPLLQPSQRQSHASASSSVVESERNKDTSAGSLENTGQIFNMKLLAVMICFFMNGLCTTGVGVRGLASCSCYLRS